MEADIELAVENIQTKARTAGVLDQLRHATDNDDLMQSVMDYTQSGWPQYIRDVLTCLKKFYELRSHLFTSDSLLLYDDRIYVPPKMQEYVLNKIHQGHQGISKCRERAKSSVFWIRINQQIQDLISRCEHCQKKQKTQKREPLMNTELPSRPWQHIAADLCEHGRKMYLVVSDYCSRFLEISELNTISTSSKIIGEMKKIFARHGIAERLRMDNGPQFSPAEFRRFAEEWDFLHET